VSQTPIFDQLSKEFEEATHKQFGDLLSARRPEMLFAQDDTVVLHFPIWAGLEIDDDASQKPVETPVRVADVKPALPEYDGTTVVRSLGVPTGTVSVIARVSKQDLIDSFKEKAAGKPTVLPEHHRVTAKDLVEAVKREFPKLGKRGDKETEENIPHETEASTSPDDSA